jgi:hypothetical protein
MKYIKYFEARLFNKAKETDYDLIEKYEEDIIKVLSKYYATHTADLCDQIDELIWDSSEDAAERFEDNGNNIADEECIRLLVNDIKRGGATYNRNAEKLIEIYYDCRPFVKLVSEDLTHKLQEIFYDYSDDAKAFRILKTSKFNDDRYEVHIAMKDIFFKINFEEVFGRIKDLGFESYSVNGVKNGSTENMNLEFWKPLTKELRDELGIDE